MPRRQPAKKKPARRSPISRQEGERRLIAAATSLLQSRPFSTVSVRDLSMAADVHQSYIHTWFGSQSGLYVRVLKEISMKLLEDLNDRSSNAIPIDPTDPTARFAVRLLFWLDLEGCDLTDVSVVLDELARAHAHRLTEVIGLDPKTAASMAPQGMITFLGLAAFGHLVGADSNRIHKVAMSWLSQVASLAKATPPTKK